MVPPLPTLLLLPCMAWELRRPLPSMVVVQHNLVT